MTDLEVPDDWTPDELQAELKRLAQCVVRLGTVDWGGMIAKDDVPAAGMVRVTTLVNAAGMLGSLAMAAQVPMDDFVTGIMATIIEHSATTTEGA